MANIPVNANDAVTVVSVLVDGRVTFDFDFRADRIEDLKIIYERAGTGTQTLLTGGIDFTATSLGVPTGGEITLTTITDTLAGDKVTIYRDIVIDRETDFSRDLFTDDINAEQDRIFMILQELARDIDGAIRVNPGEDPISVAELEAQVAAALAAAAAAIGAANSKFLFETEAQFSAADIPSVTQFVTTAGYYSIGDGGGHMKRRISTPGVIMPWHKQSADGAWWQVAGGQQIAPQTFGARGDGVTDDTAADAAFQQMEGVTKWVPPGRYLVGSPIPAGTKPFVVVASGQSNMVGYSGTTGGTFPSNANVHMWLSLTNGGAPQWIQNPNFETTTYFVPIAATGTYHELGGGKSNLALAFAHRLQQATGRPVWLILDGLAGATIAQWVGSGIASVRYASLRANVAAALPLVTGAPDKVQFMLWQQGEADSGLPAGGYQANLNLLLGQLEAETWWDADTQFIAGLPLQTQPLYATVTADIRAFAAEDPALRKVAESTGIPSTVDNVHFTGPGLYTLGYERYWDYPISINRFDTGALGNGRFLDADATWDQAKGDRERDSYFMFGRDINANTQLLSPAIKVQTHIDFQRALPDPNASFKLVNGAHFEATYDGYYKTKADTNQNFTVFSSSVWNRMAGLFGSLAFTGRAVSANERENPLIADTDYGSPKQGVFYAETRHNTKHINGGYSFNYEGYLINGAEETLDIPYQNDDEYSFLPWTTNAKFTGGGNSPISSAILMHGLSEKHGFWNGIVVGASMWKINGDTQGPAGTVGINLASWRAAVGYGDIGIKFRTANRHTYFREGHKSRSSHTRFMHELGPCGISIEGSAGETQFLNFRTGATGAADGGAVTTTARLLATASQFDMNSPAGELLFSPVGVASWRCNSARFAPVTTNTFAIGSAPDRVKTIFLNNAPDVLSDERAKLQIDAINDDLLDAWEELDYAQFVKRASFERKGDAARQHFGVIAQRLVEIFERRKWKLPGFIRHTVWEGGDEYSVLYEEVLCIEAAYQRRRADRTEQRLAAIEAKLAKL